MQVLTGPASLGCRRASTPHVQPRMLRCKQPFSCTSSSRSFRNLVGQTTCPLLRSRPARSLKIEATSASAAQTPAPDDSPKAESGPVAKLKALLSPFSEPSTNSKLLALCASQALSSVATLIHDTYLPLYLSEELKLSNTKVSLKILTNAYVLLTH